MVLSYLKENAFIDTAEASHLLQLPLDHTRSVLDRLSQPVVGLLERRGQTRAATYHLSKGLAKDLLGKTAYTRTKGIDLARYAEIVRQFVSDYGKITPRECRELLGLGDSSTARVQVSQYLKKWSSSNGFLRRVGSPPRKHYYVLNE
jgi:ATP-dependent DNA helicase RecG